MTSIERFISPSVEIIKNSDVTPLFQNLYIQQSTVACEHSQVLSKTLIVNHNQPYKDELQTALFKDPVRTAL